MLIYSSGVPIVDCRFQRVFRLRDLDSVFFAVVSRVLRVVSLPIAARLHVGIGALSMRSVQTIASHL